MWNDYMIGTALQPEHEGDAIAYVPEDRLKYGDISQSQIQPASLDVRLGEDFIRHPDGQKFALDEFFEYVLSPGECVLGSLLERLRIPDNVVARIEGKSSLARKFLTVHSAGFIDPGFHGDVTLELKNDSMRVMEIRPGMLIAQISFQSLDAPALRPYGTEGLNSHYQGQTGATS